jgi:hypothetical protein
VCPHPWALITESAAQCGANRRFSAGLIFALAVGCRLAWREPACCKPYLLSAQFDVKSKVE